MPTLSDKHSDTMPFFCQLSADKFRRLGSGITATRFAEIIVRKSVFGRSKRVDQFGFAGIRKLTNMDVPASVRHHYPATSICLAGSKVDGLTQILLTNFCSVPIRSEERGINWHDIFNRSCACCVKWNVLPLIERGRRIIMYFYKVPGNIVPTYVEMIDY